MGLIEAIGTGRGQRILVVDDDRHLQYLAGRILKEAGYLVELAADGDAALEKIREQPPDLLILDMNLPRVDGRGVLAHLRGLESPPPVLVLTAHGHNFTGSGEVKEQAAALMSKPFSLRELLATCERILKPA